MELDKYIDQRLLKYISITTKNEILERIADIPFKHLSIVPQVIDDYIVKKLEENGCVNVDSVLKEWFEMVDEDCCQLGTGYSFTYDIRHCKDMGKMKYSPSHWGISRSRFEDKHKQTEIISLIIHLKRYAIYLDDTVQTHRWGN